ncbi:MAG: YajD family HNH nuclease [Deltaproteobacteria bacterium]|nr:YajD family HNH nuclease [Deltaproteobacteria bacterium]
MANNKLRKSDAEQNQILSSLRQEHQERQAGYRERALKLFPWVCARCTREFEGKKVRELTVHHIDHNHDNNPPDGSNWELLCLYCHDHEHTRGVQEDRLDGATDIDLKTDALAHSPFAGLAAHFKQTKK